MTKWRMDSKDREALDIIMSVGEYETLVQHLEHVVNQRVEAALRQQTPQETHDVAQLRRIAQGNHHECPEVCDCACHKLFGEPKKYSVDDGKTWHDYDDLRGQHTPAVGEAVSVSLLKFMGGWAYVCRTSTHPEAVVREHLGRVAGLIEGALASQPDTPPTPREGAMKIPLKDYGLVPYEDKCCDRFYAEGQTLLCQKPIGHAGWHESGDYEWETQSLRKVPQEQIMAIKPMAKAPLGLDEAFQKWNNSESKRDTVFGGFVAGWNAGVAFGHWEASVASGAAGQTSGDTRTCVKCGKTESGWKYNRCPDCGELADGAALREALERILNEDDEHMVARCFCKCGDDPDCCEKVGEYCPWCIARGALGRAALGQKSTA